MKKWISLLLALMMVLSCVSLASAEEQVTLRLMKAESSQHDLWVELAEYYTANVAPNVKIELESYDDEYPTVLGTRINAGETPDIFVSVPYSSFYEYAEYAYDLTGHPMLERVPAPQLEGLTVDGKVLGVAFYGDAQGIIYNKAMFADAGIEKLPATFSELREACDKLVAAGYTPFFNCYGASWVVADAFSPFFALSGNYDELAAGLTSGENSFATTGVLPNFLDWVDMSIEYGNNSVASTFQDQYNAFAFEECAMILQGNWYENSFNKLFDEGEKPFEIGMFPLPVSEDPEQSLLTTSQAWGYLVSKDGEHVEEALAFLEWILTTAEGNSIITKIGKLPLIEGMSVQTQLNSSALEYIDKGQTTFKARSLWPYAFESLMIETVQAYILGDLDREAAYAQFAANWAEAVQ